MKHAKLQVGFETFLKWIQSKSKEEPIYLKINNEVYYVNFDFSPEDSISNASIGFIGIHEEKQMFRLTYADQLQNIVSPSFPEDEILGFVNIIEVDEKNIELYYYLINNRFDKELDSLLQDTPKSWDLEIISDFPKSEDPLLKTEEQKSLDELILDFWNRNMTVKRIRLELQKYNYIYSDKTIRNRLTQLRKKFGEEKIPLRLKTLKK